MTQIKTMINLIFSLKKHNNSSLILLLNFSESFILVKTKGQEF